jgi:hypothetical protein
MPRLVVKSEEMRVGKIGIWGESRNPHEEKSRRIFRSAKISEVLWAADCAQRTGAGASKDKLGRGRWRRPVWRLVLC